jgi:hypothetical protein
MISDFPREVDGNCASLDCYAASILSSLPSRRDSISVASCVCVCVVTIGRILKTSNKEIFLKLCEIMTVPKFLSGCEIYNLQFNEKN